MSRVGKGLDCPECEQLVEGYVLTMSFEFIEGYRERLWDEYVLKPCGHCLIDVEVFSEWLDTHEGVDITETWLYDRLQDKTLLVWLDREPIGDCE